jgi:drug/metabolite transporter (DMT)-like permease
VNAGAVLSRRSAVLLVALAQLAIGAAAVFARFALVSGGALAISFARLTLAALVVLAVALPRGALRPVGRPTELRLVAAGLLLAVHFAAWITSLKFASVAISTLLVCTTPVWAELAAVVRRRSIDAAAAASVVIALIGVGIVVGAPASANQPLGIVLALIGAVAFAAYLIAVRGTDAQSSTLVVTSRTYSYAALALGAAALVTHDPLPPLTDSRAWGGILAMAFFSQLFGHTALNASVRILSATLVSTFILLEPLIAAVLAAWLFGERIGLQTAFGALLVLIAIGFAVRAPSAAVTPADEPQT